MTAISADPDELRGLARRYADGGATYRSLSSTARAMPLPAMPGHVAHRVQASLGEVGHALATLSAELGEHDSRLLKQTAQRFDDSQRSVWQLGAGLVLRVGREAIPVGDALLDATRRLQWVRGAGGTYLRRAPIRQIGRAHPLLRPLMFALDFAEGAYDQQRADRIDPRYSGLSGRELVARQAARGFARASGGFVGASAGAGVGFILGGMIGGPLGAGVGAFIGSYLGGQLGTWVGDRVADARLYDSQTAVRTAVSDFRGAATGTAGFVGSVVGGIGGLLLGGAGGSTGSITGAIEGVRIGNVNGTAFGKSIANFGLNLLPFGLGR